MGKSNQKGRSGGAPQPAADDGAPQPAADDDGACPTRDGVSMAAVVLTAVVATAARRQTEMLAK